MDFRIGQGYDVHRLAEGETLWLGGILIPHSKGTIAHSDGDVLIHAICDALLGALKLRDIGTHFPDSSDEFKNIDSKVLLKKSYDLVKQKGYEIVNIDSTISAQQPKLKPFIPEMEIIMAAVLEIDVDQISVKATTTEKLGFEGREEGISASAIVLLKKS
ncbi:MAG: 2-C-methyl-D-erythritol 2,4-cyclodiphosphate synthase [Prolixibacteraceae bacterium]|jgi:2-C-methyl-D-erythritol 2,4-cyclodiphosphate synthase|nr:2-C-methyl-D-erythritol 2,4-cyclodiphosphate synthase [Prolixibacteraceae bacterium]MBT6007022.1 2-C-methyl-D-erythritol 2,4-cyclodiphosphate synthase [Prolixibacteraceae bacterium]MBT6767356.1 2-C-methyl-D-erythritol 2,4-cyclodiphosphate synthase [Prolixibacteraceae bacterium]MBT6997876.1 2-C-methyl-D-erythritol 2,4-cyclodiphosphate synthase [Prolixibacteraceae bacterium]MBT7394045.1 2-C-methyl-D-erythritol 2,4-cyclodiphosphate synthase [Prolixibacteraceae bacterium]